MTLKVRPMAIGVAVAAALSSALIASPAAQAAVPTTFSCANAVAETVCKPYPPAWSTTGTRRILINVTNDASLGERCRLYVDGVGTLSWIYINELDRSWHYLGTVPGHTGFNLRCQRRDNSGDPNIGGNVLQQAA